MLAAGAKKSVWSGGVWSAWLLFMLLLWSAATGAALRDEPGVALVIGNSAYKSAPLRNPINDARAMSERLRGLGFEVIERTNLKTREIAPTLREFRGRLKPGSVALFFYAGHGLQIKGVNYLPTVDADIESEDDVTLQSIDLNRMLDGLAESKTRLNLVFLDACRNNPFTRSFRSSAAGLAKVDAPSGTLISFATRPGSTAYDGDGTHGLYTEHLLRHMNVPDVPVELMLKRVVSGVKKESKGQQEPWMEGSIEGDFSFVGNAATTASPAKPMVEAAKPVAAESFAVELAFWESIRGSKNPREYQAYLKKYPDGQFADLAREHANGSRTLEVQVPEATPPRQEASVPQKPVSGKPKRPMVAIAGFENKSTYSADKLWDTSGQLLTTSLLNSGSFRVVEWEKMKQLFDWQALSTNSLVKSPEKRSEARKILLCEYFVSGAVTQYNVALKSEVSAFSKRKTYTTNVRVDLVLQDAATGEYLAAAVGKGDNKQEFSGGANGGQTGSWDPASGDAALDAAIQDALKTLVKSYRELQEDA
jgi:uncharacterized caspase-like protein/curli biogenesis system outer membrane secretion channel CsgG